MRAKEQRGQGEYVKHMPSMYMCVCVCACAPMSECVCVCLSVYVSVCINTTVSLLCSYGQVKPPAPPS